MTVQERGRATRANVVTALATYAAALVLGGLFGAIGSVIPCSGFLCSIGNAVLGAGVGVLASALIAAVVARRHGVRWWYTPIAYGLPVLAVAGLSRLDGVTGDGLGTALWVLGIGAPVLALAAAGPMRVWVRVLLVVLLAVAVVVVPVLNEAANARDRDRQRRTVVATWRNLDVPVYAPVGRADITVNALGFKTRLGAVQEAWYDMAQLGLAGEARVLLESGPGATSRCDGAHAPHDLGEGVVVLGDPADPTTICRSMGGAKLTLWQDGSQGDWAGARLIGLARDLEATDTQWLEQHLRGR